MTHSSTARKNTQTATKARPKQLRYLGDFAEQTGTSFVLPNTAREASAKIQRLLQTKSRGMSFAELAVKPRNASKLERTVRDAAQARNSELTGYGATATWSNRS